MTSRTEPRCKPEFPATGVLLDNSALVRLWKCDALDRLRGTVELHVAGQVGREFRKQGPAERAAFGRLALREHIVHPGSAYWADFCRLRGARYSTSDLGDDESLAIALVRASDGSGLPLVTYDRPAARHAATAGIVTMDFLDTLAWLVGCGQLSAAAADELEVLAASVDGWRRPTGYVGQIETVRERRQAALMERVAGSAPPEP